MHRTQRMLPAAALSRRARMANTTYIRPCHTPPDYDFGRENTATTVLAHTSATRDSALQACGASVPRSGVCVCVRERERAARRRELYNPRTNTGLTHMAHNNARRVLSSRHNGCSAPNSVRCVRPHGRICTGEMP